MLFQPSEVTGHKYEITKGVFEDLITARGDLQRVRPKLVMNSGRRFMAWMHPGRQEIGLEEKAYDICTSFGKDSLNALAALLAHEVVHYYEKHDWTRHFINLNKDLSTSEQLEQMESGLKYETQADYLGGILAIAAGYNTYEIFSPLLRAAYTDYGLPERLEGYPSLTERLRISANTADQLRKIHSVYQTANLLTLIGAHETANTYYHHLLTDYQSYEVYNNAGVNALLAALPLFEKAHIPLVLPLELDLDSRLDALATRLPRSVEERREALLIDAERWFISAMQMGRKEAIAYLNNAAVHILRHDWFDANYWATKALLLSEAEGNIKQIADAKITLGVIAFMSGDKTKAKQFFTEAVDGNPSLANLNQALIIPTTKSVDNQENALPGVEMIENVFPDDFLESPDVETTASLSRDVFCGRKILPQSRILLHYANDGEEYVLFHQTQKGYTGKTLAGLGIGASKDLVQKAYNNPAKTIELKSGSCWLYEEKQILFIFNKEEKLEQWVVFRKEI